MKVKNECKKLEHPVESVGRMNTMNTSPVSQFWLYFILVVDMSYAGKNTNLKLVINAR